MSASAAPDPGLRFDTSAASLVGQVRVANEDSFTVTDTLVAVADGMGGHAAGEVASAIAVEVIEQSSGSHDTETVLGSVIEANTQIYLRSLEGSQERGMGTTLCVAAVVVDQNNERIAILNVGDSRVYLLAEETLHQLTEDHSLVETLVREGKITPQEAMTHPQRNVLTRALGVDPEVTIDAWMLDPREGDRLLLCSDGLFNELSTEQIERILVESETPEAAVTRLSSQADAAGGRDNITAVVADVINARGPAGELESRLRWLGTSSGTIEDDDGPVSHTASVPIVVSSSLGGEEQPEARPSEADDGLAADHPAGESTQSSDGDGPVGEKTHEADQHAATSAAQGRTGSESDNPTADSTDDEHNTHAESEESRDSEQRRFRWRITAFLIAIAAVLTAGLGAAWMYANSGWTVAADGGKVIIHRGRVTSIPLIGGRVVEVVPGLLVSELTESNKMKVEQGRHFDSRAQADRFVGSIHPEQSSAADQVASRTTKPADTTSTVTTTNTTAALPDTATDTTVTPAENPGAPTTPITTVGP